MFISTQFGWRELRECSRLSLLGLWSPQTTRNYFMGSDSASVKARWSGWWGGGEGEKKKLKRRRQATNERNVFQTRINFATPHAWNIKSSSSSSAKSEQLSPSALWEAQKNAANKWMKWRVEGNGRLCSFNGWTFNCILTGLLSDEFPNQRSSHLPSEMI